MAKYSKLKGYPVYVSRDLTRRIVPILRWVSEAAPRQKEKSQANNILKKIYGIEDWRQVILTKGEVELLSFIRTEFPEGVPPKEGEQLDLFTISPGGMSSKFLPPQEEKQTITLPFREKEIKPNLKRNLTPEEQAERNSTINISKYIPKPQSYFDRILKEPKKE